MSTRQVFVKAVVTGRLRAIRYGAETCPRTVDVLGRFGGVLMDPKYTRADVTDIVAAVRKVYPEVMKG